MFSWELKKKKFHLAALPNLLRESLTLKLFSKPPCVLLNLMLKVLSESFLCVFFGTGFAEVFGTFTNSHGLSFPTKIWRKKAHG